jgi:hypothetical protein
LEAIRERLLNRRFLVHVDFEHDGHKYVGGAGYYNDGRLAEVWLRSDKHDSNLDFSVTREAILCSLLLQYGAPADKIMRALSKRNGGAVAHLLALVNAPEQAKFLEGCERDGADGPVGGVRAEGAAAQGVAGGATPGGPD